MVIIHLPAGSTPKWGSYHYCYKLFYVEKHPLHVLFCWVEVGQKCTPQTLALPSAHAIKQREQKVGTALPNLNGSGDLTEKCGPWILSRVIVITNKVVFGASLFGRESEMTKISLNLIWKPRRCVHRPLGKYAKVMIPIHFSHFPGSDFRGKISE